MSNLHLHALWILVTFPIPMRGNEPRVEHSHVSTVGKDEQTVRKYIKEQEATDRQLDQLQLDE